jgi:hypothetical protein
MSFVNLLDIATSSGNFNQMKSSSEVRFKAIKKMGGEVSLSIGDMAVSSLIGVISLFSVLMDKLSQQTPPPLSQVCF